MACCICALALLLTAAGQAPAQPDLSGRWVLIAPDAVPRDVPTVLTVNQHLSRTDMRGNPMQLRWDRVTVEGDELRSGIRSGTYRIGGVEGTVSSTGTRTEHSVRWDGDTLVITNEKWIQRETGERESLEQHREVWALGEQGQLVITVTDRHGESRTRTFTYRREVPVR
jgi:hypothetical protein